MLRLFEVIYQSPCEAMKEDDVFWQYDVLINSREGAYTQAGVWAAGSAFILSSDPKSFADIKTEIAAQYRVTPSQVTFALRRDR